MTNNCASAANGLPGDPRSAESSLARRWAASTTIALVSVVARDPAPKTNAFRTCPVLGTRSSSSSLSPRSRSELTLTRTMRCTEPWGMWAKLSRNEPRATT